MIAEADALSFCDRWLAAWSGNQPESLLEFYTEDAFYRDPANTEGLRGHSELLVYFRKLLSRNPDWQWKAVDVFPTDRGFTLKWSAVIPVPGGSIREQGLDIVELRGTKISRNEVFFDRLNWVKALERAKSALMIAGCFFVAGFSWFPSQAYALTEVEAIQKLEEVDSMRERLAATLNGRTEPITAETFQQVCAPVGKSLRAWAEAQGVRARQLSHKPRNPAHAIKETLEKRVLQEFKSDPSRKILVLSEEQGDTRRVNVVRRIRVASQCLHCHGQKEKRPEFIVKKYPQDNAFGFSEGDLRGLYWVDWVTK